MSQLEKSHTILGVQLESDAYKKAQTCSICRSYPESAKLHEAAAKEFLKDMDHNSAGKNYYAAADILRKEKIPDYTLIRKHLSSALKEYRSACTHDVSDIFEELIEIDQNILSDNEHLALTKISYGDYLYSLQGNDRVKKPYKALELLQDGGERLSLTRPLNAVDATTTAAKIYIIFYHMYNKASSLYKQAIDTYKTKPVTKDASCKFTFLYGLCLIAYEISDKTEPEEINEQTKEANEGYGEMNLDEIEQRLSNPPFMENGFDLLREFSFLTNIVKSLREVDLDLFNRELGRANQQLTLNEEHDTPLLKIKNFLKMGCQPVVSIL